MTKVSKSTDKCSQTSTNTSGTVEFSDLPQKYICPVVTKRGTRTPLLHCSVVRRGQVGPPCHPASGGDEFSIAVGTSFGPSPSSDSCRKTKQSKSGRFENPGWNWNQLKAILIPLSLSSVQSPSGSFTDYLSHCTVVNCDNHPCSVPLSAP